MSDDDRTFQSETPPGPLTLEEAEEWLLKLEDIATLERDLGFATRLVLFNLFGALARAGLIDGTDFIGRLRNTLPLLAHHERLAVEAVIGDLLRQSQQPEPSAAEGGEGLH